ncbi:IS21-like element helper ATPase IstB [Serratia fonticola]
MSDLLMQLRMLKLSAMAEGIQRQRETPQTYDELGFEERLGLLAEEEHLARENNRVKRLRRLANLKHAAAPEGLQYPVSRGLRAEQMRELLTGQYLAQHKNILITGPTGSGKSWVASALGEQACRQKYSVQCWRVTRLLESLATGHVDGSYLKQLKQLQKVELLLLDDLGLESLRTQQCNDLLEILEDRHEEKSTIVISQLPVDKWYGVMENPTAADAILDRLIHNAHRLALRGESMRKKKEVEVEGEAG